MKPWNSYITLYWLATAKKAICLLSALWRLWCLWTLVIWFWHWCSQSCRVRQIKTHDCTNSILLVPCFSSKVHCSRLSYALLVVWKEGFSANLINTDRYKHNNGTNWLIIDWVLHMHANILWLYLTISPKNYQISPTFSNLVNIHQLGWGCIIVIAGDPKLLPRHHHLVCPTSMLQTTL